MPRDPVPDRTLYPSFSLVLTTVPLVPGTAAVSRLRTLNRFTLADVSWSRLRKMDDGVDEDGRRRRRLPSENKGFDVRSADNTLLLGCAATGPAAPSGGCKQLNYEAQRQTDGRTDRHVRCRVEEQKKVKKREAGDIFDCGGKVYHFLRSFKVFLACPSDVISKGKGKGEAVPLQAWSGPEGSRKLRFPDYVTMDQDGGKVVSLTHRPPLHPGNAPGTHFC